MSSVIEQVLSEIEEIIYSEVEAAMTEAGEAAVEYNRQNGDYQNITGNLRRSNYYEIVKEKGKLTRLVVGNSAEYASHVEARGKMVTTGGALLAAKMLSE